MTHFLAIVDADQGRRDAFTDHCKDRLGGRLPGAWRGFDSGPLAVRSQLGAHVPFVQAQHGVGGHLIVGDCLQVGVDGASPAARLAWMHGRSDYPEGYFLALEWRDGRLQVGVDKMGLFPLWYWVNGEVLILTTHLDLLRAYPGFRAAPDVQGMLSCLAFGHAIGDRTQLQGVHRLPAGHVLSRAPDGVVTITRRYEIPRGEAPQVSMLELLAEVDSCLEGAIGQGLAGDQRCWLALSGGRDSRLLAGHVARMPVQAQAITFGRGDEADLRYARGVARRLGMPQRIVDFDPDKSAPLLEEFFASTHGTCGISFADHWQLAGTLDGFAGRIVTGYVLDSSLGGSNVLWSFDRRSGRRGFDVQLAQMSRRSMPLGMLETLLTPRGRDALRSLLTDLESIYLGLGEHDSERSWHFGMAYRQRLYIGIIPWVLSASAWPILPAVDGRLLALCARIPAPLLAERFLEDEVLRRRWPSLAALPLDRATSSNQPVEPGTRWLLEDAIRRRLGRFGRRKESLFFHRLLSVNSVGWQRLRARASEASLDAWPEEFDRDAVRACLPSPAQSLTGSHAVLSWDWVKPMVAMRLLMASSAADRRTVNNPLPALAV